jgi:hypothetical protein
MTERKATAKTKGKFEGIGAALLGKIVQDGLHAP